MQFACGFGETQILRNRDEITEVTQFHNAEAGLTGPRTLAAGRELRLSFRSRKRDPAHPRDTVAAFVLETPPGIPPIVSEYGQPTFKVLARRGSQAQTSLFMKSYARQASVRWQGTRQRGKGTLNTPSATLKTTLHGVDGQTRRRGTTPPELIAAAVAGSFSLSLASELERAGYKPRQIDTTATVTLEYSAARWRMTQIYVEVIATVPGAAECDFVDATLQARTNCPVSQALDVNIILSAKLTRNN